MTATFNAFAFAVGACLGSFLNVCIARWPEGGSVVRPRSRCPKCGKEIAWYDNIPVISWIVLRARCRNCGEPISAIYPAIELLVGGIWLGAAVAYGPGFSALRFAVFVTILVGIAVTDLKHYVIPDGFTVTGLIFVAAASIIGALTGNEYPFATPVQMLLGACVGAGAITIIGWLGEVVFRKEAMGFGDSTLMAMAGAALGPGRSLLTILLGALIGAIVFGIFVVPVAWIRSRRANKPFEPPLVPFGVFLAPAAVASLLWGYQILGWYLDHIQGN